MASDRTAPAPPSSSHAPVFIRLSRLARFTDADRRPLAALLGRRQQFSPQDEILTEGERAPAVYVMEDGWAYRYQMLSDGRRQILNLVLPGEMLGLRSCLFKKPEHATVALTRVSASRVLAGEFEKAFRDQPHLMAALASTVAEEESMLADRVVSLGRRSALERLLHFLLELRVRLQDVGLAGPDWVPHLLTQELLGDLLGLSIVHVNRTMKKLREENLIRLDGDRLYFVAGRNLEGLCDFEHDPPIGAMEPIPPRRAQGTRKPARSGDIPSA